MSVRRLPLRCRPGGDQADGVLTVAVFSVPLFLMVLAFVVNVNYGVYLKTELDAMAQTSVETAVKKVEPSGSLGQAAVEGFVKEYRSQAERTPAFLPSVCSTAEVDGKKVQLPYMLVRLEDGRRQGASAVQTWTVEGPEGKVADLSATLKGKRLKVVSAEVYSATANAFWVPGLSSCQVHRSQVSATTFGSNSDL